MNDKQIKATESIHDYPEGTKYISATGGWWSKMACGGFKWMGPEGTGGIFSKIGGNWSGNIILPKQ
jgi:hypothetical protein